MSMIRDPSDGSVRAPQKPAPDLGASHNCGERVPSSDAAHSGAGPILDTTTSGLQTGSTKPENIARLEKAKQWIKDYRAGKFKQTDGERECPKCGKFEVYGKAGSLCCLACGAHQSPAS